MRTPHLIVGANDNGFMTYCGRTVALASQPTHNTCSECLYMEYADHMPVKAQVTLRDILRRSLAPLFSLFL